jgi:hypothetical protein
MIDIKIKQCSRFGIVVKIEKYIFVTLLKNGLIFHHTRNIDSDESCLISE